jgi:opacity protein-like surface antigen
LDGFNMSASGRDVDEAVRGDDFLEIESWIVTGNAKGYLLTGSIQPFALVGVGAMRAKAEEKMDLGFDLPSSETDLALRFGAGVDFYLSPRFVVDVGADYVLPTGDIEDLDYVSVGIALQYRF